MKVGDVNHARRIVILLAIGVLIVSCSNTDDAVPPAEAVQTTASTSDTTATAQTAEAAATSSTLTEQALAEAKVRDVVTSWWQLEYDTSEDSDVVLEALTGTARQQSADYNTDLSDRGVVEKHPGMAPIEIVDVTVDLGDGTAEVDACAELTHDFLDAETGEVLPNQDPDGPFVNMFHLEVVDGQWKIGGWFPSGLDGEPVMCEITTTASSTPTERDLAEADVRDVVTSWWQLEFDTSRGEGELLLEPLTGLALQQTEDFNASLVERGLIQRARVPSPIRVVEVTVDLENGSAEVDACTGSAYEFLDAETLEVSSADDPNDTTMSVFQLQVVDGSWKISGWFPSELTSEGAVPCRTGS